MIKWDGGSIAVQCAAAHCSFATICRSNIKLCSKAFSINRCLQGGNSSLDSKRDLTTGKI